MAKKRKAQKKSQVAIRHLQPGKIRQTRDGGGGAVGPGQFTLFSETPFSGGLFDSLHRQREFLRYRKWRELIHDRYFLS
jgi:hypothetical protein